MTLINRKEKFYKIGLVLNCFIFLISALQYFEDAKIIFASVMVITGIFNLLSIKLINRSKIHTELGLNLFNMVVAILITYDYFMQGKHYIKYAWAGVSIAYFIFSIRQYILIKKNPSPKPENI